MRMIFTVMLFVLNVVIQINLAGFDRFDFYCVFKVFLIAFILYFSWMVMIFDGSLVIVMTFVSMPMFVGNSKSFKKSLKKDKEDN